MSSTPPSEPAPEYLDADGGTAVGASSGPSGGGRRTAALGVGGVALLGLVGAGAWAATSLLATGDQPAEVLPAATLGYAAIDLDPSGTQKVAALRTLSRFPALREQLDLGVSGDLVEQLGSRLSAESGCDLDFARDVEPWLGSRFALAAVEAGEPEPSPVVVMQVDDTAAAQDGLDVLASCDGAGETGWAVEGDWVVVATSEEVADQVVADAGESSLADDADFRRWTDEAGDAGILTAYAAPGAGPYLAEAVASEEGQDVQTELLGSLEDFGGAAMTVRFGDGGLEVETAADATSGSLGWTGEGDQGATAMAALPDDTALALGLGLEPGWGDRLVEALRTAYGAEEVDSTLQQAEAVSGLDLPADLEALLGRSSVLSLSGDLDVRRVTASADGSGVPVALSVEGDPAEVERVLTSLRELAGPEGATLLRSQSEGERVVVGPDAGYREDVVGGGGLGDSEKFTGVLPDADRASSVLYVDVDALDRVARELGIADNEVLDNVRVLSAVGASSWIEDDVSHSRLRITTDD